MKPPAAVGPERPLAPGEHEILDPPNALARKARGFRATRVDTDRIDREIASLVQNYANHAMPQLASMREIWDRLRQGQGSDADVKAFHRLVHDLKGEGGSFGFPLLSKIGGTLCLLLEYGAATLPAAFSTVEAHVAALETVLRQRIKGDGGEVGQSIVAGLQTAVRKVGAA